MDLIFIKKKAEKELGEHPVWKLKVNLFRLLN